MLQTNTVFVIGAGSGFDIKMPLGADLLQMIEKQCHFRVQHNQIIEEPPALVHSMYWEQVPENPSRIRQRSDVRQIFDANVKIHKAAGLIGSIDDYVNLHNGDPHLVRAAKVQIAYSILASEQKCLLMPNKEHETLSNIKNVSKSWMIDFFKTISKPSISVDPAELFKNVSIINFNYDRCLEQFLISAIPNLYGISLDEASKIVKSATIIHPYGQVGDLPALTPGNDSVKFGASAESHSVATASKLIRTYTEQVNSNIVTQIKNIVNASSRVVFLGFGFHKQNVDLLSLPASAATNRFIIGTAFGESDANIVEYGARLLGVGGMIVPGQRMPGRIELLPKLDCASLLQNYREVISS